ncbi:MAG TPA: ABC transporter ATP-binding protein [Acidimicrobiales bacterium]|nr:ABC transporter ATP-binding protein [Acidimicrobiales bacterium]HLN06638.1 ABC transporter ATP-binding protein [Acidimicrobiales bacterium]
MPAVEVDHLVVRYGSLVAVDGVSFEADAGEVVALLGPNGAGKTTTVETLEGFRRADAGAVRVLGLDPWSDHSKLTARVGVVLQRGGVYPVMSAERAVRLFASYYEDPRDPDELIDLVGLRSVARTPFKRLSGGEQQRLALALALVGKPTVAFLDEPTAGVDPAGRIAVRDVVAGLRSEGVCVILTSHELDEVQRLADRVVIVDHGRVVAAGRQGEIQGESEELRFAAEPGLAVVELSARLGVRVTEGPPGEYLVSTQPVPALVAALTAWLAERDLALGDLRAGRQRLEDVFLRLTGSGAAEPAERDLLEGSAASGRRSRRGRSRR